MTNWIYSNPTWLTGLAFLTIALVLSCGGLLIASTLISKPFRRAHNDVVAATLNIVGVVYAVLLAFIAVATWQSFTDAATAAGTEANYIGNLDRDATALPAGMATEMRKQLRLYLSVVIGQEWTEQQDGRAPSIGWKYLQNFHVDVAQFQPTTMREAVIQAEILRVLNELYSARRNRLLAAEGHIPNVVWWFIVLGGALVIGTTYLFGVDRLWLHLLMTAAATSAMTLAVILIIDLDYPFRGSVSVSSDPYKDVLRDMDNVAVSPQGGG